MVANIAFYHTVFAWTAEEMSFSGGTYTVLSTAGSGRERSFGGMAPPRHDGRGHRPYGLAGRPVRRALRRHHERRTGDGRLSDLSRSTRYAFGATFARPLMMRSIASPPVGSVRLAISLRVNRISIGWVRPRWAASFMTVGLLISFTKARPSV